VKRDADLVAVICDAVKHGNACPRALEAAFGFELPRPYALGELGSAAGILSLAPFAVSLMVLRVAFTKLDFR
jgi:hypothetical protein